MAKLDKKFSGNLIKVKDNTIVPEDQWVCFLAKDNAFFLALPAYLDACMTLKADSVQCRMVEEMIERVTKWREANPELCKVPDAAGEVVLS